MIIFWSTPPLRLFIMLFILSPFLSVCGDKDTNILYNLQTLQLKNDQKNRVITFFPIKPLYIRARAREVRSSPFSPWPHSANFSVLPSMVRIYACPFCKVIFRVPSLMTAFTTCLPSV